MGGRLVNGDGAGVLVESHRRRTGEAEDELAGGGSNVKEMIQSLVFLYVLGSKVLEIRGRGRAPICFFLV